MTFVFVMAGLLPYVLGYFIHQWTEAGTYTLSEPVTAILFLLLWLIIAFFFGFWSGKPIKSTGNLNFFGFANLVFVAFQLLIFKDFMDNIVGDFSWYFFLPPFGLGAELSTFVPVEQTYFVQAAGSYVLMLLVALIGSIAGALVRRKKMKLAAAARAEAKKELAEKAAEAETEDNFYEAALNDDAANDADNFAEEVKDAAEDAAEEVRDAAENAAEEVKDAAEDAAEDVKDTVKDAAEDLAGDVNDTAEEVKDAVDDAAADAVADLKDAEEEASNKLAQVLEQFRGGIGSDS